MMGTALRLVLEYGEMAMKGHFDPCFIESCVCRRKAFKITGRLIPFTVFDVVLMAELLGTGRKLELD